MRALLVAALAALIYWLAAAWSLPAVAATLGLLVVLGAVCAWAGLAVSYTAPSVALVLVAVWTPTVVLFSAGLVALLGQAATQLSGLETGSSAASLTTLVALGAGVVAALLENVGELVGSRGSGWLARKQWCRRLSPLLPSQPAGPAESVTAYRALRTACVTQQVWSHAVRREVLSRVGDAAKADGLFGGDAWIDAAPPSSGRA